jgi:hypothetical protein
MQAGNVLGFNGAAAQQQAIDQIKAMPGYQFNMDEGRRAIEAQAAFKGLGEGSTLGRSLVQFGQDYAQNAVDKYLQNVNTQTGFGLNAAQSAAGNMTNAAGQGALLSANLGSDLSNLYSDTANSAIAASAPAQQTLQNFLQNTPYGSNITSNLNNQTKSALSSMYGNLFKFK